jgi:hypothetical protein
MKEDLFTSMFQMHLASSRLQDAFAQRYLSRKLPEHCFRNTIAIARSFLEDFHSTPGGAQK